MRLQARPASPRPGKYISPTEAASTGRPFGHRYQLSSWACVARPCGGGGKTRPLPVRSPSAGVIESVLVPAALDEAGIEVVQDRCTLADHRRLGLSVGRVVRHQRFAFHFVGFGTRNSTSIDWCRIRPRSGG
jgi:hypothetical protein